MPEGPDLVAERAGELLLHMLDSTASQWSGGSGFAAMVRRFEPPNLEAEIYLLREIVGAIREFPLSIFDSDDHRVQVIGDAQMALDEAIAREEEQECEL